MLTINSILVTPDCRDELDFGQFSNFRDITDIPRKIWRDYSELPAILL
jgi:hypothetical protein